METYSLFELNEYVRRVVALNFSEALWISCEISQIGNSRGHSYIDLIEKVDDSREIIAQSSAVLWRGQSAKLVKKYGAIVDDLLQAGTQVRLKVKVDFHERYGLKLVVEDIDPDYTLGDLERLRLETIETLQRKDHIGRNAQLAEALVPQRIAVISSKGAAGYQDFRNHLHHNVHNYRFDLELYDAAVQGQNVESDITSAIQEINRLTDHYDAVVIVRGGGSKIDLSGFDIYSVCEAIATCNLPVYTGIGHDVDQSVADLVSFHSCKTPTAVADYLIDKALAFDSSIYELKERIFDLATSRIYTEHRNLEYAIGIISFAPKEILNRNAYQLQTAWDRIQQGSLDITERAKNSLHQIDQIIKVLDPVNVLKRGFSVTRQNGKAVNASMLRPGDTIETEFADGSIISEVKNG